ncbi:hypothetical protein LQ327_16425 [Actinomycetospora endophytica]|uniref:Uncharacterized protein n=1 Tax=Actinomycetospora endophytica TaxID=2291215 RepID=A0ABS8P9Q3_9PSEU|nr:hypothetical protein [Actinomycetospora endophytica]MCD2194958.1 hypothetical protein [Actinomycetospora endophytica]
MSIGPIVWSIIAVLVALVVLALLLTGTLRAVGRTTTVLGAFTDLLSDRTGMLRARLAAVKVRIARLRGTGEPDDPASVDSAVTSPLSEGAHQ